jgi:hypothetical protein
MVCNMILHSFIFMFNMNMVCYNANQVDEQSILYDITIILIWFDIIMIIFKLSFVHDGGFSVHSSNSCKLIGKLFHRTT